MIKWNINNELWRFTRHSFYNTNHIIIIVLVSQQYTMTKWCHHMVAMVIHTHFIIDIIMITLFIFLPSNDGFFFLKFSNAHHAKRAPVSLPLNTLQWPVSSPLLLGTFSAKASLSASGSLAIITQQLLRFAVDIAKFWKKSFIFKKL